MTATSEAFQVRLSNFEGPFDLLLQLIAKHKLDVTEIALAQVTDEFLAHVRDARDLERITSFLVVAATLLDLKAARLLPRGEVEDADDLAALESADLLFARLLQYRAIKEVAAWLRDALDEEARRHPHPGGLEERFARLLPEVELGVDADRFAQLAALALAPRQAPAVSVTHLHVPRVSVAQEASVLVGRLRARRIVTFRSLIGDAADRLVVVARFLALLELAREKAVSFEQLTPLGDLTVRWTGSDEQDLPIGHEDGPAPHRAGEDGAAASDDLEEAHG